MRIPLEVAPAQIQLWLPDLAVVAGQALGGGQGRAEQDAVVHHVLGAGEPQAAQVLVCLLVHHQQPRLRLHGLDALHDLEGTGTAQHEPRGHSGWQELCPRVVSSSTVLVW